MFQWVENLLKNGEIEEKDKEAVDDKKNKPKSKKVVMIILTIMKKIP